MVASEFDSSPKRKRSRNWSKSEVDKLKHLRLTTSMSRKELADVFGKTEMCISRKMYEINVSRKWRKEEDDELIRLAEEGLTLEEIVYLIKNRDYPSIRARIYALNIDVVYSKGSIGRTWNKSDEELLKSMYKEHALIKEIAKKLERTCGAITTKIHKMKLKRRGGKK